MAEFVVLGAGMAGVGAALALRARGHGVTLVDRRAPGQETSHGNAGVIQAEAAEPYAMPRDLATLWRHATGHGNDIVWNARALVRLAPALMAYRHHSAPARHALLARAYAPLTARATADHAPLIAASESEDLIRRTGLGEIYRSPAAFDAAAREAEAMAARHGLALGLIGGDRVPGFDPALTGAVAGIVHWTDSWSCRDPGALTQGYARLFEARGGQVLRREIRAIQPTPAGWRLIAADAPPVEGSDVVIALGPWAPELLRPLGYRIAMVPKRGYHAHFQVRQAPARPYLDAANGVVMASMAQGLRITTGAELTGMDAPQTLRQLDRGRAAIAELVALGPALPGPAWHGHRPCLPDMLPLVGPAPRHRGLWFDFGHGHQGFTLGPTTGEILADRVAGRDDALTRALAPAGRVR